MEKLYKRKTNESTPGKETNVYLCVYMYVCIYIICIYV